MLILALAIVIVALIYFFIRKKSAALWHSPLLKQLLTQHIDFYNNLNDEDKKVFEQRVQRFLTDVHIEGLGFEIHDIDSIMVASSAVIPIFGFKGWTYRNVTNVLLYPDTFNNEFQFEGTKDRNILGMVGSGYMNGQMILSRSALVKGFSKNSGEENTGIHEFVHLLDKADGATDGIPESFLAHEYIEPWVKMMHQEIRNIEMDHSDINPYATTNQAEFFAVVSEYFFKKPDQFQNNHPELYAMLSKIFGQHPAE
ncbi:MAG: peptidase [Mucilaginibacter sp.]|nr:peptidase [Mucilaginibacter sp.]